MTVKKYYHIGIAVDTPHGLMVPKLRNADNNALNNETVFDIIYFRLLICKQNFFLNFLLTHC